jgi:hypothetical protein
MSPEPLVFHLSHVRVELDAPASTAEIAGAVWGGCHELVPATVRDTYHVHENGRGGYEIRRNGELLTWTEYELDVVPRLEALFYERVHDTKPEDALFLHGAALLRDDHPLVLVGPSGAGKSTLSLAGVRAGLSYLTDELIGTDGQRLWGMPRAIQFDAMKRDVPRPPWLEGIDTETFRIRHEEGGPGVIPITTVVRPAPESVAAKGATVVVIGRGAKDEIASSASVEGVRALYEAAHRPPRGDLGGLVGRAFALTWADPARAMDLLLAAL